MCAWFGNAEVGSSNLPHPTKTNVQVSGGFPLPASVDEQAADIGTIIDRAQATRPVVVGVGDSGPAAVTYVAENPSAVTGLVLINTFARIVEAADYPGVPRDIFEANVAMSVDIDAKRDTSHQLRNHAPSVAGDAAFRQWWDRASRRGASPGTASALWHVRYGADVRDHLCRINVPTLIVHRRGSRVVPLVNGEYLPQHIDGAQLEVIEGRDQPPFTERRNEIADLVTRFATDAAGADRAKRP